MVVIAPQTDTIQKCTFQISKKKYNYHCQTCSSILTRWGKSKSGSLRYKCKICRKTSTPRKKIQSDKYFSVFRKWVQKGISFEFLKEIKGVSASEITFWRHFDRFLKNPPRLSSLTIQKEIYLKLDGKYFGRWGCVLLFKEGSNIIYWEFVVRENYAVYSNALSDLKRLGYVVLGVTSDWHGSLVSAVKTAYPDIPHQRCLVHTQQMCQRLLTKKPKTEAGRNLLELANLLNEVRNHTEKEIWLRWLERFEERFGELIKERTYSEGSWWYTHKNLRRAFRTLKKSTDNLFLYLNNKDLVKDTNGVESEFSHLKEKLGRHRGLKRERKVLFVYWYFYFKSIYFKKINHV